MQALLQHPAQVSQIIVWFWFWGMVFVTSWGFALDVWYLSHWTGVLVGPDYCWSFKSGQRRGTQRTPLQRGRGFIFLSNQTKPADIGQKSSRHEVSEGPRSQIQLTRLCCQGLGKRRYSWYGGRLARDTGSLEYTVGVTCWPLALWSFTWNWDRIWTHFQLLLTYIAWKAILPCTPSFKYIQI